MDRVLAAVRISRRRPTSGRLGLHRVEILEVDGFRVRVSGIEALDGTPVVDVKPVLGSER